MRLLSASFLISLLCLNGLSQTPQPTPVRPSQANDEVFQDDVVRVDTTLVGVPVTVLDRDGRFVADLKQNEFHLYEDGVEQQVAVFAPVEIPVTVLLLFDNGLLRKERPFIRDIHKAALAFAEQLRPGDKVIVAKFGGADFEVLDRTADGSAQKEPHKVKWHFSTSIHDAVSSAIKQMNAVPGRKAIVLFSDGVLQSIEEITEIIGGPVISDRVTKPSERTSERSTIHEAEESDAPIYVMDYDTMTDGVRYGPKPGTEAWRFKDRYAAIRNEHKLGDEYLHSLAEKSGARLYQTDPNAALTKTFAEIAAELSQQYSLGYYPKKPGQANERHEIKVRVDRPGLAVRSRTSYIYSAPKPK